MSEADERIRLLRQIFGVDPDAEEFGRVIRMEPCCSYRDVFPTTSGVIADLLMKAGHPMLAEQIPNLKIYDRCSCEACASFYTQPKPEKGYGPTHWGISLDPPTGMIIFDIVGDRIAFIEILDFPLADDEVAENWPKFRPSGSSKTNALPPTSTTPE